MLPIDGPIRYGEWHWDDKNVPAGPIVVTVDLEEADWRAEDPKALAGWLEQMLLIRRFEEKILELHGLGLVHGPAHAAIGQEAGAVGAMSALDREDKINGTHRAHHQVLAKLVNAATPQGYDALRSDYTPEMAGAVEGVMTIDEGGSSNYVRHREKGSRDVTYPASPEPLAVPVYDNHCHLEIQDGDEPLSLDEQLRRAAEVWDAARNLKLGSYLNKRNGDCLPQLAS